MNWQKNLGARKNSSRIFMVFFVIHNFNKHATKMNEVIRTGFQFRTMNRTLWCPERHSINHSVDFYSCTIIQTEIGCTLKICALYKYIIILIAGQPNWCECFYSKLSKQIQIKQKKWKRTNSKNIDVAKFNQ